MPPPRRARGRRGRTEPSPLGRGGKAGAGAAAAAASSAKAPSARELASSFWAVISYQDGGYHLDTIVTKGEDAADVEVAAALDPLGPKASSGFRAVFKAHVSAGARSLSLPGRGGVYDVWLFTRNVDGFRQYEVKLAKYVRPSKDVAVADIPAPEAPEAPGEEWVAACIERRWIPLDKGA